MLGNRVRPAAPEIGHFQTYYPPGEALYIDTRLRRTFDAIFHHLGGTGFYDGIDPSVGTDVNSSKTDRN